ncbi:MAG: hypothetical protein EBU90_27120, partial [Proteobacteria bacterium]|nr:hypothetical protein [Pseudomonadota bacterium]
MKNYTCKMCLTQFSHHNAFANHLKIHKLNSKSYYDMFLKKNMDGICKTCKKSTKYLGINKGYAEHCSIKCCSSERAIKQWKSENSVARKKNLSQRMAENKIGGGRKKGSRNKNQYPLTEKVIQRMLDYPPPSWKGKKHKIETLEKMSEARERIMKQNGGNMAYKGKFVPK